MKFDMDIVPLEAIYFLFPIISHINMTDDKICETRR